MTLRGIVSKYIHVLLPLSLILVISRSFPVLSFLYFAVIPLLILFIVSAPEIFVNKNILRILLPGLAFSAWCLITSLRSPYPLTTVLRSIYFLFILLAAVSAAVLWKKKYDDLNFLIPANAAVILLSLLSLAAGVPDNAWSGGNGIGFMGFAGHQNTLGFLILLTLPGLIVNVLTNRNNKWKWILLILLSANKIILILSYSRASILSVMLTSAIILVYCFRMKAVISLTSGIAVLLLIYFVSPAISASVNKIIVKNSGSVFANRTLLWTPSLEAAKNCGLFGLGYGISDPAMRDKVMGQTKDGIFIREKGNSILAVVEETGIVGLILMLIIFISLFTKAGFSIVSICIMGFIVHSQFEAWKTGITGAGLMILFCLMGTGVQKKKGSLN